MDNIPDNSDKLNIAGSPVDPNEITVTADLSNLDIVTDFIDERLAADHCRAGALIQINVAIDEIFSNVAHYAYTEGSGKVTIKYDFWPESSRVSISFTDSGIPFNPLEHEDPDITLSLAEREVGGLGIMMVKKTMDSVGYRFDDGCNILTIEKTIF